MRRRVACVLSPSRPDYTGRVRKNPLFAIRMVVLALLLFMIPSRRSLFGVGVQVVSDCSKRVRRRGEMTVSVSIFLVCVLASC